MKTDIQKDPALLPQGDLGGSGGRRGSLRLHCKAVQGRCSDWARRVQSCFGGGLVVAANGAEDEAANAQAVVNDLTPEMTGATAMVTAANAADGWLRLLPYGEYPHPVVGVQVVDQSAVERMAANLKGLWPKLMAALGYFVGVDPALPVFNGHPDDAHFAANGHNDWNYYARVPAVEARADGMWIDVRWSPLGRDLLGAGQKLFFSPRWAGRSAANGKFELLKLLSFGLFPNPNIREAAAANAASNTLASDDASTNTMNPILKLLLAKLGFASDEQMTAAANAKADGGAIPEAVVKLDTLLAEAGKVAGLTTERDSAKSDLTAANGKVATLTTERDSAKGEVTAANAKVTAVSNAARDGLIHLAIESGTIPKADEAGWKTKFDADFGTAANGLRALKTGAAVKTTMITNDLGGQRSQEASNARDEFRKRVLEIQKERGWTPAKANAHARLKDPKGKLLHEAAYPKA